MDFLFIAIGREEIIPDSLTPAEATDMRLLVVDFPTAAADIVLLYLIRRTLAGWRTDGEMEGTCELEF